MGLLFRLRCADCQSIIENMAIFLFWNLDKNEQIRDVLVELAYERNVDVLILAECPSTFKAARLLSALNQPLDGTYHYAVPNLSPQGYQGIEIYSRFASSQLTALDGADGTRFSIRQLRLTNKPAILLVAAHLHSKFPYRSREAQIEDAKKLARGIIDAEDRVQHRRTVLVGDLNMNPFEQGMIFANALHGVMTRRIAEGKNPERFGERLTEKELYRMFYNPMWRQYGELNGRPAGTHYGTYYYEGGTEAYFWHILDQVLVRPALLPSFRDDSVEIITRTGSVSLVNDAGVPDRSRFSDHLPLLFESEL